MWSKIIVLTQIILVAQSITVPPFWPKQNADVLPTANIRLPIQQTNIQSKSFPIQNYNNFQSTPVVQQNHEVHLTTLPSASTQYPSVTPKLQYRSPINQEVYIYHPPPSPDAIKNIQLENHKPSSYQIVNFDNQEKDIIIHSKPKSNIQHEKYLKISNQKPYEENVGLVNKEVKKNERNIEQTDVYKDAISEHEFPRKVPTKPIYPGEGKWADYQLRHAPYIYNKKEDLSHRQEENEKNPEGYDIFVQGQEQFQQAQNKFRHDLDTFPQSHNLNPSQVDEVNTESQPLYEKPEIDFVPQKLYAQVRRTETEQHLPKSAIDPEEEENAARLREVIKNSKIHTVYSEEGYEDSAYDHAGHEKHAENSEGHSQLAEEEATSSNEKRGNRRNKNFGNRHNGRGRNIERRILRNNETGTDEHYNELSKYSQYSNMEQDADSASSNMESKRVVEFPTKNMKTVKLQIGDQEGMDMEIHTEVKYVPGTPQKKHKFIKIIPSYKKYVDLENKTNSSVQKSLKRVKRYDNNDLSKRYVRKRPNYYWKKVKTSTTERPLINMRRKFEAALKNHNRSIKRTSTDKPLHDDKQENSTPESIISASTILSPTITSTSTTPIPPATPPIDDILEKHEVTMKSSKPNPLKVKIRKYVVKRQKRFTIDHPNINVDLKEFIDVKALPNPTPKPDLTYLKYPYYKSPITDKISEYSPLRYAEDMKNIPRKTEDLSFYKSRSHIKCPQIESNVDPIPDRIKEQEKGKETVKMDEEKDGQRLSGLGDKIDCLKIKYFGENPLDSPIFQEEFIDGQVNVYKDNKNKVKVLSVTDSVNNIYLKSRKYDNRAEMNEKINDDSKNSAGIAKLSPEKLYKHKNELNANQFTFNNGQNVRARKRELKIKILEPIIVVDEGMFSTTTLNPILRKSDAVLKPPFTLLEMVDRNQKKMKLKPKSIYDQITILEEENNTSTVMSDKVYPLSEKFIIIYDNEDNTNVNKINTEHSLENKIKMIKPAIGGYKSPKVSDIISDLTIYSQDIEQPEVINLLDKTSTKTKPTDSGQTSQNNKDQTKETLAPMLRKISVRKPVQSPRRISNRKLQRTTFRPDITTSSQISTPKKSLRPKSEIPQSQTLTQAAIIDLTTESSLPIKNPYAQINRRSSLPYIFDISRYLPKIPNHKIITSEVHYKDEIKPSEQMKMYSDVLKTINEEIEILSEQPNTSNATFAKITEQESADTNIHDDTVIQNQQSTLKNSQFPSTKSIIHNDRISEPSNKVVDLVPPSNGTPYRTLLQNSIYKENREPMLEIQNAQSTQNINYYHVIGLKPPPKNYNFQTYRKIIKRQITQNSQSLQGTNHQTVNEKENIHNSIPFAPIGNERLKRDVSKIDYNLDDLVAEESRTYEVTPSRKPKVYTEIVRAKSAKTEMEEDSEDLNPRKRVYELKQVNPVSTENTINFEEVIEDEIENQTESPTSPKPIIYPVEANSDNPSIAQYVFLIDRLHDKWERENPTTMKTESIPETTSQMSVVKPTETTQSVAESINIPSGEPAFLQIINQLHNIREDEEKKNPPSTTTVASVIIEENSPSGPVKNSNPYILDSIIPESFMSELSSMQAKLDPEKSNDNSNQDGSPRPRNFSAKFKTSIDTSKYKTIARNPISLRHNLSSRYNADDQELPLSRVHTTQLPTVATTKSQEDIVTHLYENAETTIGHDNEMTTNKAETEVVLTTTARTRKQSRSRSRPTTTTTTQKPTSVTINPTFRRRRPTRITTEATISTTKSESLHTRRRSRFRPESQIRSGASESLTKYGYTSTVETPKTEETVKTDSNTPEDNKKQRRLQTIHERRVVSEVTLTRFYEPSSDESGISSSNENVEESKTHQYQIAGPVAHGATELYSHPELAKNVNQLKDEQQLTTEKNQKLSSLNTEEIVEKFETIPTNGAVNLYPNMARMINRLAESQPESQLPLNPDTSSEDDVEDGSSTEEKPVFIKDPSKRMYYYVKL